MWYSEALTLKRNYFCGRDTGGFEPPSLPDVPNVLKLIVFFMLSLFPMWQAYIIFCLQNFAPNLNK